MEMGEGTIGSDYWLQWQVPVCALVFVIPCIVALKVLRKGSSEPLRSADLWIPCWRNLNPVWLLFFRASALASLAFTLYLVLLRLGGAFAFYFYTQWTFALVTVYFGLVTIISARGCWKYSKKAVPENGDGDELLKKEKGTVKLQRHYSQDDIGRKADFLECLAQAIYQTCAGAVMLTDIVFWCLLLPFMLDERFQLTLLIGSMHSINAVFLILDSALNSQPFPWFGLAYFVLWSVSYVVFQWVLHACGFTWWPYPFLELSTPWAPLWYLALALVHLPCYGIYALLAKAKVSVFSRMFPKAYMRSLGSTGANSSQKKHI